MGELVYTMFINNNRTSFHLWWKRNLVKDQKVSKYYENNCRFNGVYYRDNLPDKIKAGAKDVINLDEHYDIETHWIALYALNNNVTYFDGFVVEHIPKEIKIFIDKSIVVPNIFRIQVYDSVMYENIFVLELLILCLKARL